VRSRPAFSEKDETKPTMNVDAIRAYCLTFSEATEKMQWGDDLCFKFRGKIFAIVTLDDPKLCFKCDPETFAELIERENIRPAPYVGRYKWVMLDSLVAIGNTELKDLIRQSYDMVVAKAPKSKDRPNPKLRKKAATRNLAKQERVSNAAVRGHNPASV
jgi:predicted DNA-binding protein (MmcQ/YjbR family)